MKTNRTVKLTEDELTRTIDENTVGANEARRERLEVLQSLSAVRHKMHQTELKRLAAKHGAGHALIAEAETRVSVSGTGLRALGMEIERTNLTRPQVQKDSYIVFGLVRDASDKLQDDVLVQLVDENGTPVMQKPEQTDRDGAFRISLPVAAAQPKAKAVAEAAARGAPTVRIEVLSAKGKRLALDPIALRPTPGVVEYREVVVGARPLKKTTTRGK